MLMRHLNSWLSKMESDVKTFKIIPIISGNTGPYPGFLPTEGIPVSNKPMVFVAMPRLERAVPITLGYVTDQLNQDGDPLIAPYPNWNMNRLGDCDSITSVYRVQVSSRIFVLERLKMTQARLPLE